MFPYDWLDSRLILFEEGRFINRTTLTRPLAVEKQFKIISELGPGSSLNRTMFRHEGQNFKYHKLLLMLSDTVFKWSFVGHLIVGPTAQP